MESKMYETVVEYIKEEIKQDRLRIGNKLPTERELSATLDLGRNSIREALRTLSSLGIIESRQGSGNYLTGDISKFFTQSFDILTIINKTSPLEISQMRRALEVEALRQLIEKITPEQVEQLQVLTEQIDQQDSLDRPNADLRFHQMIIEFCGNTMMMVTVNALSAVFLSNVDKNLRRLTDEGREVTHRCHHQLVDALRKKNFEKGIDAIATHYNIVDDSITENLQDF